MKLPRFLVSASLSCVLACSEAGTSRPDAQDEEPPNATEHDASSSSDAAWQPEPTDGSVSEAAAAVDEILTNRYDNARTGANLAEQTLSPARLSSLRALGSWPVDGEIYAQVLVAADVQIDTMTVSLAIVATMNNSIYAFDADAPPERALVWHQGSMRELGVPGFSPRNVGGPHGILSTPVIDKQRSHLYAVSRDCDPSVAPEAARCSQRLAQLDLRTGEVLRTLAIAGHVTVDAGSNREKKVAFDANAHWNRPGLLLAADELYVAFGSGPAGNQREEDFVYHGWVFRFDVRDLDHPPEVYCTSPRGRGGSIWQAGAAPAADEEAVYATGANGIMDDGKTHPPMDWPSQPKGQEDSVFRLPRAAPLPSADDSLLQYSDTRAYLSAGNVFQHMESGDNGFGSSGPTLIPDTNLLLVGTKAGLVYLLARDTLHATQEPLSPFAALPLQSGHTLYLHSWWGIPMTTQSFVFWRPSTEEDARELGYAFAWPSNDKLRSLRFDYRTGSLTSFATADVPALKGGGNMVLSAARDRRDSGILWVASPSPTADASKGQLWAFDPLTLAVLWKTETPAWSKFTPPSVARGRVLLPTTAPSAARQQVMVYGLPP